MYTILVVDDSLFVVDVFVTMLERGGYSSFAAYGGEECLEILKTVKPDLILLDIMMEPMDGWKTLEKIKENSTTKDIPVPMLTAKPLTPTEAEKYGALIEDYVLKPITDRELYDAVEHVFGRRETIRSDMARARQSGVDFDIVNEYALLSTSVDVNKKLLKILDTTYNAKNAKGATSSSISKALKNIGATIKFQETRLQELKEEIKMT